MRIDISIEGRDFYSITGRTRLGRAWVDRNVDGSASGAACSDDTRMTEDIAEGATRDGLRVSVNGYLYLADHARRAGLCRGGTMTPVEHADAYRGYGRALRILPAGGDGSKEALTLLAHIAHYLYESGHVHWLELWRLPIAEFARAFDDSRAKWPQ